MLSIEPKSSIFSEPHIREYFSSFHSLSMPLRNNSLSNAWNNVHSRKKLIKFFREGLFKNDPELADSLLSIIQKCSRLKVEDEKTVSCLKNFLKIGDNQKRAVISYRNDENERVRRRALQISSLLKSGTKTFLDIGCGNGAVLETLTGMLKLPAENSVGTDVYNRTRKTKNFSYLPMEKNGIPAQNDSFDAAALLMTLHHENQPENLIREAARVIKKGGQLIIRDHDAESIADNLFFEAMDTIYFSVINPGSDVPLSGKYRSGKYWEQVAHQAGFKTVKFFYPEPDNPMKPFHLLLEMDSKIPNKNHF